MSREIKFRVYSKGDREYRTDCRLKELFNSATGTPAVVYNDEGDGFVIEQYTGLKDKNGKEIYEGDIIKAKIGGAWATSPNTIGFGKATWSLRCYWDGKRYAFMWHIIGSKNCPDRVYDFYDYRISDIEVIGNIHENPELLGGEE